jgi:adenylate kinase family enzyme
MKIHIFGASGSGVTTLGQHLALKLQCPYFDNDDFYWEKSEPPFTIKRLPDERNSLLKSTLAKHENWILGGSMINWGEDLTANFDLIVFLWIPSEIRIERLKKREFERYGDIIFTNPERNKLANDFFEWAADYDNDKGIATRTQKNHEKWLSNRSASILRIEGDFTVEERVRFVIEKMKELKN